MQGVTGKIERIIIDRGRYVYQLKGVPNSVGGAFIDSGWTDPHSSLYFDALYSAALLGKTVTLVQEGDPTAIDYDGRTRLVQAVVEM